MPKLFRHVENCQNVETADWLITRSDNLFFDQKYCTTIQLSALYKIIFFLQTFKILLEMTTNKVKGKGRPQNEVWDHYTQSKHDSEGHASATCNFCEQKFSRGNVTTLQGHIANHCLNAPSLLIRKYQNMFEEKANKTNNKKRKNNQTSLHNYHDTDEQLSQGRIDRINRALLKLFVCCGISFRIVESPFFIDFLHELNTAYDPPSRELLANRLFEDELGNVNSKINRELEGSNNLTLGILILKKL